MEEAEERLLPVEEELHENLSPYTSDGSFDKNGNPALKQNTGNWRACSLILLSELCVCMGFYAVVINLVVFLKNVLDESNVVAARDVATWLGTCFLTPLVGAFVADSYLGNYLTSVVFLLIYLIGMITLTLSSTITTILNSATYSTQYSLTFFGLYMTALGSGAIKPCFSSFGPDQFDDTNRSDKASFFTLYYLSIKIGSLIGGTIFAWLQDNYGWLLGFGLPTLLVGLGFVSFLSGSGIYRYRKLGGSPFTRVCQVIIGAVRKYNLDLPSDSSLLYEITGSSVIEGNRKLKHTAELRFLDKAALVSDSDFSCNGTINPWRLCTITQVEELKIILRLLPIWATLIFFTASSSQESSVFVEQGMVMNKKLGSFTIPPASLTAFNVISVIICAPIYDKIIIPVARRFTGRERGFTELQRLGIGLFLSTLPMVSAALVETKRLAIAREKGLIHEKVEVPMSILWQIPQYFLIGTSEVFNQIALLEFFYNQAPDTMRSLCMALGLVTISLGSYVASFIVTFVGWVTVKGANPGWIPDNLNEGHLDRFFWLVAGLCLLNLMVFVYFATRYQCKRIS